MRAYLKYVLRRTLFVLGCLGTGLLGWPGLVGAQESLLNSGRIDTSGARRITVTPAAPAVTETESGGIGGMVSGFLGRFLGDDTLPMDAGVPEIEAGALEALGEGGLDPAAATDLATALRDLPENLALIEEERDKALERASAFGAMMYEMNKAEGDEARAAREQAEAAATARPRTEGERLFAEFGWHPGAETPYELSRAALAARP
ncbi:hypothetical protein [Tropicimonas sediminicola]|uniref:Uncharacterized protein n=1 Tax=Tropicimonas sediminicola TaxID=1031541 RepID=A0A239EPB1_9RHOB|nr:hypothetical protein [Tropicimonas sediminicola]SNS46506.1 hypothetical protein SAMN05421757_102262 [Tropicimonas sediminicola]